MGSLKITDRARILKEGNRRTQKSTGVGPVKKYIILFERKYPKYRGCNPIEWAIINGEKKVGVTLHRVDTKIDAGNIIKQKKILIKKVDTWKAITTQAKKTRKKIL